MALFLLPAPSKQIFFVRHAEGTHNVAGAVEYAAYRSEAFFDAPLTALGWSQATALRAHVQKQPRLRSALDLVVVSPLTRALQTAVAAFGGEDTASADEPLLMSASAGRQGVSARGAPPFVACELCREHLGVHPCDRRRTLSEYKEAFPAVDWTEISTEEDVLWRADHRETDDALAQRAAAFLEWLQRRPEENIAVVAHSSWLSILFQRFTHSDVPQPEGERMKSWFANAELRTVILHMDPAVGYSPPSTDFKPAVFHRDPLASLEARAPAEAA
jgi:broad specificity phosphatase PhoE